MNDFFLVGDFWASSGVMCHWPKFGWFRFFSHPPYCIQWLPLLAWLVKYSRFSVNFDQWQGGVGYLSGYRGKKPPFIFYNFNSLKFNKHILSRSGTCRIIRSVIRKWNLSWKINSLFSDAMKIFFILTFCLEHRKSLMPIFPLF